MFQSKLYQNAKRATVKEARSLRVGDIIECYYMDSETPTHELVIQCTESSKYGTYDDVRTIRISDLGARSNAQRGTAWLNTGKFKRIAHGFDIAQRLALIVRQANEDAALTKALTM